MKKAIITFSVILLTTVSAFAGGDKTANRYYTPKANQGWFIDLAGTYSIMAGNNVTYHDITTYYGWGGMQLGASGKIGRRVSPSLAVRGGYDWHKSSNSQGNFNFHSLHIDVMESPLDLFLGYNPDRLYTMWLYGGVGLLNYNPGKYKIFDTNGLEFGVHGGLMNNFRLTNSLDLHIDLTGVVTRWSFDEQAPDNMVHSGRKITSILHRAHFDFSGMVGLMYYFGGRRLDASEVRTIESDCSAQERRIQELAEELERCRANNNNGSNNIVETKPCDTIVKFVEGQSLSYPFSIFFNKGSYDLRDGRDRVNLEEFAKAAKENGYKIVLRGTCDSATASNAFNKTLAENRCNKVKQELVKLGVPENNITINPVGGVKELNPTEYDRRVLIQLSK